LIEMIRETGKLADCPEQDSLIHLLTAQMRKSYTAWNRSEINNEQIAQDIWDISDGKIKINPDKIHFAESVQTEASHQSSNQLSYSGGHISKRKRKMIGTRK